MDKLSVFYCAAIIALWIPVSFSNEEPEIVVVKFKESREFICQNAPPNFDKPKWYFNDEPLNVESDSKTHKIVNANYSLVVIKFDPETVGKYSCDIGQNKTYAFVVHVYAHVMPFDKTRNVIEGDPMSLECKAYGVPTPVITWQKDGVLLVPTNSGGKITFKNSTGNVGGGGNKFPVIENGTLRIEKMEYAESGNYTCFATNQVGKDGKDSMANATLLVQVKDKYAALWPFLGICAEVGILCAIILIYEKRRAKRIEEEERQEEAAHLNANNEAKAPGNDELRQRK